MFFNLVLFCVLLCANGKMNEQEDIKSQIAL